jgi:hypothetical protein
MLRAIRVKQDEHDHKSDEVITRLGSLERDFAPPGTARKHRCRDLMPVRVPPRCSRP